MSETPEQLRARRKKDRAIERKVKQQAQADAELGRFVREKVEWYLASNGVYGVAAFFDIVERVSGEAKR